MRLSVEGETRRARDWLLERATGVETLTPVADQLLNVLRGASARQFATGAGWPRSEKASGLTLVGHGDLRDSLTRAGGNARVTVRGEEVSIESLDPSARYLADGARGMPVRNPSDVDEWQVERGAGQTFTDYLTGGDR